MFSINQFQRTARAAYYTEIDAMYLKILKMAMDDPNLRRPRSIREDSEALERDYVAFDHDPDLCVKYDTYAFVVWNFLETIHDRCHEQKGLRETWTPVIEAENALHRGWFLAEMRGEEMRRRAAERTGLPYKSRHKFCKGFRIFIVDGQWLEKHWAYRRDFAQPIKYDAHPPAAAAAAA